MTELDQEAEYTDDIEKKVLEIRKIQNELNGMGLALREAIEGGREMGLEIDVVPFNDPELIGYGVNVPIVLRF